MILSYEEKILIEFLFKKESYTKEMISKIDLGKLIEVCSKHLMIPALYYNLKKKKILNLFPKDFTEYIYKIYNLNKERNQILINEIFDLANLFDKNNLKYVFLKGSSNITSKCFDDISERMVGDIDFLFEKNNEKKVIETLNKNGYYNNGYNDFFDFRHTPRMVNPKKYFAIEPHRYIISKKNIISNNIVFKSVNEKLKIKNPDYLNQLYINIYNYQINDNGYEKLSYSFKNIYDSIKLIKKIDPSDIIFDKSKEIKRYFIILNKLNIFDYEASDFKTTALLKLKYNYINIYKIYVYLIKLRQNLRFKKIQLFEFLKNKNYRNYLFSKLFTH